MAGINFSVTEVPHSRLPHCNRGHGHVEGISLLWAVVVVGADDGKKWNVNTRNILSFRNASAQNLDDWDYLETDPSRILQRWMGDNKGDGDECDDGSSLSQVLPEPEEGQAVVVECTVLGWCT